MFVAALTLALAAADVAALPLQPPAHPRVPAANAVVTSYPASFFAPAEPNTARDMLDRLPGFVFDGGDTVRGFAGAAGNVLVDGTRPTSKTDDLDSVLRRIPASQVDHIDLIRGGAPGIDMQGKTVVANVVRRSSAGTTGVAAVALDYLPADGRVQETIRLETTHRAPSGATFEGSFVGGEYFDDGAGDGNELATGPGRVFMFANHDNTEGGGGQAVATGAYSQPLLGGAFRANLQLLGNTYIFDERDQDVSSLSLQPTLDHQRQNKEQGELGLTFDRAFGPQITTETLFIQQLQGEDFLDHFSQPGDVERFREQHTNGESILRSTVTYTPWKSVTVEAGGEGDYNWIDSHTSFSDNGVVQVLPAAVVNVQELRGELFGKATWVVSPQFTVEAGLRLEASHLTSGGDVKVDNTFIYPKPRLVLTWSPDPADQFRFRIEEEVTQLDFTYFTANSSLTTGVIATANPNLTPQQAIVTEAAYERRFWNKGDVSVTYRHSQLSDVIDRAPVLSAAGDFDQPANIGGGTKDELIAAFSLPIDRLGVPGGLLKANATWRSSRVTDPTTGERRPLGQLRPREGEIDFTQDLPRWRAVWGAAYNLGWRQTYYNFDQVEIDNFRPYVTMFFEFRPRPGLSLRGELNELGTDFRRTLEIFPGPRGATMQSENDVRSLYFGPELHFRVRQTI